MRLWYALLSQVVQAVLCDGYYPPKLSIHCGPRLEGACECTVVEFIAVYAANDCVVGMFCRKAQCGHGLTAAPVGVEQQRLPVFWGKSAQPMPCA